MKRFVDWLSLEWSWKRIVIAPFVFALIWLAFDYWFSGVYPSWGPDLSKDQYPTWEVLFWSQPQTFLAAFLEELLFRLVPLCTAVAIIGKSRWILLVALVASLGFGASHSIYLPVIATHTALGLSLCFLFLKCGGYRKNEWWGPAKALTVTTMAHALNNLGKVSMWWYLSRWGS